MQSSRQVTPLPKPVPVLRGRRTWGLLDPPAGPPRPPTTLPSPGPSSQGGEHGARVLGEGALGSGQGRSTGGPPCQRPSLSTCSQSSRTAVLDFCSGLTVTPPSSAPAFLSFKTFLETAPYEETATVPLSNMAFTWDVVFSPPVRCLQAGTPAPPLWRQPCSPEGCGRSLGKTDPGSRLAEPSG